ncbi:hypothetical protein D3C74_499190 [compost metagenome]
MNFNESLKTEVCQLGEITYKNSDSFEVKAYMDSIGFYLVRKKELPSYVLGLSGLTPDKLDKMVDEANNLEM